MAQDGIDKSQKESMSHRTKRRSAMRTTSTPDPTVWTADAVRQLGMTTDVETAAAILSIGRTKAYELAKSGEFPVKVLRIGRRYVVPVPALVALLQG
jgi:hypothetical protein